MGKRMLQFHVQFAWSRGVGRGEGGGEWEGWERSGWGGEGGGRAAHSESRGAPGKLMWGGGGGGCKESEHVFLITELV